IALIRVSGSHSWQTVDRLAALASGKTLRESASHTIHYGTVTVPATETSPARVLDQVLFLLMAAPRTFTGENTVEITCHNNQFIINDIVDALCAVGARRARPGEFSQRAVTNGKMDLLQAEAIHELITAPSQAAVKAALAQVEGSLSNIMQTVEQQLLEVAVWVEASFEFLDEEQRDLAFEQQVRDRIATVQNTVDEVVRSANAAQHLREGVRIALVGSVNAGKSTLLNALLGRERALVSDQAGTTRDTVEAGVTRDGYTWTFIDTAGLRRTDDRIEQAGIERSYAEAAQADVVLVVIDGSRDMAVDENEVYEELLAQYGDKSLVVVTKVDKEPAAEEKSARHSGRLSPRSAAVIEAEPRNKTFEAEREAHNRDLDGTYNVSAHTQTGITALQDELLARVKQLHTQHDSPYLLNQRQINVLEETQQKLAVLVQETRDVLHYELIAAQVHDALALLTELTGHNVSEKVMDLVFKGFCVGK
ncbi:MAG: tRNA uridine-5-carboxymethylaminomethyl(34) synthesis GTPase MnmE, partial [Candidatus Dependentiae bacterium]